MSVDSFKEKHLKDEDANLTLTEKKKKKQDEIAKEVWELEQIDNDSTGDAFVIKTEQAKEKKAKALEDDFLNFLDEDKNYSSYRERLAAIGIIKLKSIEFAKGWEYFCIATKEGSNIGIKSVINGEVVNRTFATKNGIAVILKDPAGGTYIRAIGVTYDPVVDHGALTTLVIQAENTYDKVRGYSLSNLTIPTGATTPDGSYTKDKSGLFIPTK
jgi:hypothetical protein